MTRLYNRKSDREKRRLLRKNMTEAERILWSHLRRRQLGSCKFRRQYSICGYVIDFYSPELRLAIEVDGGYHTEKDQIIYDKMRQYIIESLGIEFLRFTNNEIHSVMGEVVEQIHQKIAGVLPLNKGKMSR
ncbi:hypothetical protein AMJ44_10950 [candidate division WOR-1 bacterium DG_54_3]|uniref:DUF559 domain-containing protein n=1 Tax=candidate division WOR-1 bacterium DG_54_3 TaxID=1703775 RepID=A0A0S7XRK9_UNCSA|nr:MAG: hypothetical protein AMJ44_10950 [candidate division WOR-1 bacterium DG_54_3]